MCCKSEMWSSSQKRDTAAAIHPLITYAHARGVHKRNETTALRSSPPTYTRANKTKRNKTTVCFWLFQDASTLLHQFEPMFINFCVLPIDFMQIYIYMCVYIYGSVPIIQISRNPGRKKFRKIKLDSKHFQTENARFCSIVLIFSFCPNGLGWVPLGSPNPT